MTFSVPTHEFEVVTTEYETNNTRKNSFSVFEDSANMIHIE